MDIMLEDVRAVVRPLKSNKCGGADNLDPEQLKFGGECRLVILCSHTARMHPTLAKMCVIIPVFKGKG